MKRLFAILCASLAISVSAVAAGPTGLGPLRLGMTKEAVEALGITDGVYLAGTMTPYDWKNAAPIPGEDKFDAAAVTPLSATPLKAVLTFTAGQLVSMSFFFDDSSIVFERAKAQIVEKYGSGKLEDNMKEEQCIYRGGQNFKIKSGSILTTWVEQVSPRSRIETRLLDLEVASCPSNLRYGSVSPLKLRSLSIRNIDPTSETKPKNLF